MQRRIRKPNFTYEETMALLEQIEAHKQTLFGKSTNYHRAELWVMIAETVNAVPSSAGRTVEDLKHRWKDLSHRTRTAARRIQEASVDSSSVTPSIYYHTIMKIIGEDFTESKGGNTPLSAGDGQTFVTHNQPDGPVDIKPDIIQMNGLPDTASDKPTLSKAENKSDSIVTAQDKSSGKNRNNSNNTSKVNSSPSPQIHPYPQGALSSKRNSGSVGDLIVPSKQSASKPHRRKRMPQSLKQLNSGFFAGRSQISREHSSPVPVSRPMKFDPDTQQVLELGHSDVDSDFSDDVKASPGFRFHEASTLSAAGKQELKDKIPTLLTSSPTAFTTAQNIQASSAEAPSLMSLSMEDLQKLYVIKKIHMVEQRTSCYRLLEKKIECEMEALQTQHWAEKRHLPENISALPMRMHSLSENNHIKKRNARSDSDRLSQNHSHKRRRQKAGCKQVSQDFLVHNEDDGLRDNINDTVDNGHDIANGQCVLDDRDVHKIGDYVEEKVPEKDGCTLELVRQGQNMSEVMSSGAVDNGQEESTT